MRNQLSLSHFARNRRVKEPRKESGGTIARRWSVQQAERWSVAPTSPRLKCQGQPHPAHKASTHGTVFAFPGFPLLLWIFTNQKHVSISSCRSSLSSSDNEVQLWHLHLSESMGFFLPCSDPIFRFTCTCPPYIEIVSSPESGPVM